MLSLVLKDLEAGRWYLPGLILLYMLQLAGVASSVPAFVAMTALGSFGFASVSIFIEEAQGTELLWRSLPVSGRDIILARYVTTSGGICFGSATSIAISYLLTDESRLLEVSSIAFGLLLAAAVFLPLYYRFGTGRALHLSALVALGLAIAMALIGAAIGTLSPETGEVLVLMARRWQGAVGGLLLLAGVFLLSIAARLSLAAWKRHPD